jgi:ring-1,2-phenylacetyl-CoA epoxidase subunit PaaE
MNTTFYTLQLDEVSELTRESIVLRFNVPEELKETFKYTQGQHLTIKAMVDGQEVRRSYSICENVQTQILQVAVKKIPDGIFSNYANNNLKEGMSLEVMPPQGSFSTELKADNHKHYLCIAAGSGITPILSHIRSILSTEPNSKVTLIFSNKSTALMMFRNKLSFTKNEYLNRFQWVNLFTKEQQDTELFNGRVTTEKLVLLEEKHLIQLNDVNEVFLCGPEEMINNVIPYFESKGLTKTQIHYELFFIEQAQQEAQTKSVNTASNNDNDSQVSVRSSGRKTTFKLGMKGLNILDAAMEEGADLPYSCKGGVCATCKAKLLKGEVKMDQNHSLSDEEVGEGMILTCQSHPLSPVVEIDFDAI